LKMEQAVRIIPEIGMIRKSKRAELGLLIWQKLPPDVRLNPLRMTQATQQQLMEILETNIRNQTALRRALAEEVRKATEAARQRQSQVGETQHYREVVIVTKPVAAEIVKPEVMELAPQKLPQRIEEEAKKLMSKVMKLRQAKVPLSLQAELKFYDKHAANLRADIARLRGLCIASGVEISGTIVEEAIRSAELLAAEFERRAQQKSEQLSKLRKIKPEEEG